MKLINDLRLVRPGSGRQGVAWKVSFIWLSNAPEHSKDFYCMKCGAWKKGASSSNVGAHCRSLHKAEWEAVLAKYAEKDGDGDGGSVGGGSVGGASAAASGSSAPQSGSGGGGQQAKLGYLYGASLMKLHRSLTAFLIRDMRPFNLIEGEGFKR